MNPVDLRRQADALARTWQTTAVKHGTHRRIGDLREDEGTGTRGLHHVNLGSDSLPGTDDIEMLRANAEQHMLALTALADGTDIQPCAARLDDPAAAVGTQGSRDEVHGWWPAEA